jgi:hypothetical protein
LLRTELYTKITGLFPAIRAFGVTQNILASKNRKAFITACAYGSGIYALVSIKSKCQNTPEVQLKLFIALMTLSVIKNL